IEDADAMYSKELLNHFENPRNAGDVESPTVQVQVENPACGDVMQLALRIHDGRIIEARFRCKGCAAAIACGSVLTELIQGASISGAQQTKREQLVDALGGLAPESSHASHLAINALRAALRQIAPDYTPSGQ